MVEITKAVITGFLKTNLNHIIIVAIAAIAAIVLVIYVYYKNKKTKMNATSLIDAYKTNKKRGKPKKAEKIELDMEEPPMDSMESILEKDMEKWKGLEKQLDIRRGEILHLNNELEEELARIDAWKRFIKDVFSKVGKEEK